MVVRDVKGYDGEVTIMGRGKRSGSIGGWRKKRILTRKESPYIYFSMLYIKNQKEVKI